MKVVLAKVVSALALYNDSKNYVASSEKACAINTPV